MGLIHGDDSLGKCQLIHLWMCEQVAEMHNSTLQAIGITSVDHTVIVSETGASDSVSDVWKTFECLAAMICSNRCA